MRLMELLEENFKAIRKSLKLSPSGFALEIGISFAAAKEVEMRKRRLSVTSAKSLLLLILLNYNSSSDLQSLCLKHKELQDFIENAMSKIQISYEKVI